jgi:hypothetical protein
MATDPEVRVRFPALPDFLRSSGSGTGSTLPSADRGYDAVSVTDPDDRIRDFLDRSRYFFFQIAPQLYSRG